ncbi:uncharacterized protein B0H64DRAFT_194545 [Chaetomium fimeti]|uniref:Atos-like conserved domain-containing protein n=1 Tax=Chaetomium fimeti TaxID=1854472 RepID=A0AAE0HDV1_9PEZI|nr:hypothetical protein B0H64DRAFT_194545 [Chaetomium fimeti]
MPMLHEDDMGRRNSGDSDSQCPESAPVPIPTPPGMARWSRRLSEESIRTELCEGPVPDSPPKPSTPQEAVSHAVCNRAELIERLKRGESPAWVPNRLAHLEPQSDIGSSWLSEEKLESLFRQNKAASPPRTPRLTGPASPGLLPAPTITPEKQDVTRGQQSMGSPSQEGLNIERPRSALHSGNFTPVELSPRSGGTEDTVLPDSESHFPSASAGWMSTSPPRDYTPFDFARGAADYRKEAFKSGPASLSSSLSSSFAYQPPTSPLVQSESNEDLDFTLPLDSFNIDANSPRNPRRHTLNFGHSPFANPTGHRQSPLRRESTYPYQAHQPRRSLSSTPNPSFTGTPPQTPALFRSRRPSFGSEASPLHHASMVGSYEESILRGRMSTIPSRPLEFTAQIGVLGLGKCKASLRCPAHVTLPFSAVFYNYASTSSGASKVEDGPSPYVGQIDLENGLPNPEEGQRAKRKLQTRYQDLKGTGEEKPRARESLAELSEGEGGSSRTTTSKRPSRTPKAPPGGGYRIPEKGQLQIIIKNQNKTAVKLFLIPYDLAGMEPGTKTFIRQRSYSAGPIIEAEVPKDAPADRPILRYLIHLHICCPSKGRHYLYKSIRVVFANRVPDGKEKLRNEVTYPDPRFSPYKPVRVMHPPPGVSGYAATSTSVPSSAALAAEQAFRRRSLGFPGHGHHPLYQQQHHHPFPNEDPDHPPQDPQPNPFRRFSANPITQPGARPGWKGDHTQLDQGTSTTPTAMPGLEMTGPSSQPQTYDKLSKGDLGYGGVRSSHPFNNNNNPNRPLHHQQHHTHHPYQHHRPHHPNTTTTNPGTSEPSATATEGLLSKRLRSLGVQHPPPVPTSSSSPPPPPPPAPALPSQRGPHPPQPEEGGVMELR